jgi:hypothetical protein
MLVKVPPYFMHIVIINCTALNDGCVLNISLGQKTKNQLDAQSLLKTLIVVLH